MRPAVLIIGPLLIGPGVAWAQGAPGPVPMCTEAREGMVACFGPTLCACRFDTGGSVAGRPPAHRWDCGIYRPPCGVPPASQERPWTLGDLPPLLLSPQLPSSGAGASGGGAMR